MSAYGQRLGRAAVNVHSAKKGSDLLRLCAALRATAIYDSTLDLTLNGTDVSGLANQGLRFPRPLNAIASLDLTQGTGANQPLSTGAPTYGGFGSIQFTAANNDTLFKSNIDLAGLGPITFVIAAKFTTNGSPISNSNGIGSGVTFRTDNRSLQNLGGGGRTFSVGGALDTTAPHVLVASQDGGENSGQLLVDGTALTMTPAGTVGAIPGAAATLALGSIQPTATLPTGMDFLFLAVFQYFMPANLGRAVSAAARAKYQF